jgi:hypothetical protein
VRCDVRTTQGARRCSTVEAQLLRLVELGWPRHVGAVRECKKECLAAKQRPECENRPLSSA